MRIDDLHGDDGGPSETKDSGLYERGKIAFLLYKLLTGEWTMQGFKTYTGIVVALLGAICQVFKLNFTTDDIQPIVNAAFEFAGLLFAAYGRYKALPKAPETGK